MSRADQNFRASVNDNQDKMPLAAAGADCGASAALSSFIAECQAVAGGIGRGVNRVEQERGYFSTTGSPSREEHQWWMDPAAEASLAAAGGLAAGLAARSCPAAVNAMLAGGAAAFAVVNRDSLLNAGAELGQGLQIAWSGHNTESIDKASEHIARAVDSPLFDLALVGGVGTLMKAVGPAAFDRATFRMTDEISPLRGSNFAENYYGKRLSRGPFYFTRLGQEGKVEYVEDIRLLEPGSNKLHLSTEPNIRLEPITRPADQELGLGGYTGPFEHPTLRGYRDVSKIIPNNLPYSSEQIVLQQSREETLIKRVTELLNQKTSEQ
ncbi:MAG TPA: hypothetical protein V6C72_19385 [Chroococcales cyanobacterium]